MRRGGILRLIVANMDTIEKIRRFGWLAVEAVLLLIVLCMLLHILLGDGSGPFIASVAGNATAFLGQLPPGVLVGLVLIAVLYNFVKARLKP